MTHQARVHQRRAWQSEPAARCVQSLPSRSPESKGSRTRESAAHRVDSIQPPPAPRASPHTQSEDDPHPALPIHLVPPQCHAAIIRNPFSLISSRLRKNQVYTQTPLEIIHVELMLKQPGCSKRPDFSPTQPRRAKTRLVPSKAAASKEARRTLRYVELLSDARTPLADFFSILLERPPPDRTQPAPLSPWDARPPRHAPKSRDRHGQFPTREVVDRAAE